MTKLFRMCLLVGVVALAFTCGSTIAPSLAPAQEKAAQPPAVMKWEYKVANVPQVGRNDEETLEKALNKFGDDGWELVSETRTSLAAFKAFILKRPKR